MLILLAPHVRLQGGLDAAAIERLKDDDAISLLFNQLGRDYPQVGVAGAGAGKVGRQARKGGRQSMACFHELRRLALP